MNEDDTNKSERSYYLTPLQEKITEKRRGAFAECVDRTTHRKGTFFFQLGACINQVEHVKLDIYRAIISIFTFTFIKVS